MKVSSGLWCFDSNSKRGNGSESEMRVCTITANNWVSKWFDTDLKHAIPTVGDNIPIYDEELSTMNTNSTW